MYKRQNRDTEASSTAYTDQQYSSVSTTIRDWVIDSARKEGDKTVIANTSTSTDDDGKETTTTQGYYAVFFTGSNDNTFPLVNVRHILVKFEGGTTDSTTGSTTNPGTGANDVVGVAAALAVVALVSGAAISLKK